MPRANRKLEDDIAAFDIAELAEPPLNASNIGTLSLSANARMPTRGFFDCSC